jgi:hypothetical protein
LQIIKEESKLKLAIFRRIDCHALITNTFLMEIQNARPAAVENGNFGTHHAIFVGAWGGSNDLPQKHGGSAREMG